MPGDRSTNAIEGCNKWLWGRICLATMLLMATTLTFAAAVPLAYGIGKSGAYVVQAWTQHVVRQAGWDTSL